MQPLGECPDSVSLYIIGIGVTDYIANPPLWKWARKCKLKWTVALVKQPPQAGQLRQNLVSLRRLKPHVVPISVGVQRLEPRVVLISVGVQTLKPRVVLLSVGVQTLKPRAGSGSLFLDIGDTQEGSAHGSTVGWPSLEVFTLFRPLLYRCKQRPAW